MSTINATFEMYAPIFVTINGDIYVSHNESDTFRVIKRTASGTSPTLVMQVDGSCFDLFVDVYNNVYCSMIDQHQVVRRFFYDDLNVTTVVGGNGTNGSTSDLLSSPRGIFVTEKFDLYVADCGNNRVQHFLNGQRNASTIIGNGTMTLNCPSGIALDNDRNVFISDSSNHRIVSSGPDGVRCIAGCSRINGSGTNQLNLPASLAFDSVGNLFVVDELNSRIQYFALEDKACGKSLNKARIILHFRLLCCRKIGYICYWRDEEGTLQRYIPLQIPRNCCNSVRLDEIRRKMCLSSWSKFSIF